MKKSIFFFLSLIILTGKVFAKECADVASGRWIFGVEDNYISSSGSCLFDTVTKNPMNQGNIPFSVTGFGAKFPNDLIDGGYDLTLKLLNMQAKGPIVDVRSFGATGDGVTNDTTAIQAAIDSITEGVVYFPKPAVTYAITQITLSAKNDVTLMGYGASLTSTTNHIISIEDSNRCAVKGLRVLGTGLTTAGHCISILGGTDCTIDDVTILSGGYGIRIGSTTHATTGTGHKVTNCRILETGNHGVYARTGLDNVERANIEIRNNIITMGKYGSGGVGVETWAGGTLIQGNTITVASGFISVIGITIGQRPFQRAVDNYVEGFDTFGIEDGNSQKDSVIARNIIINSGICIAQTGGGEVPIINDTQNLLIADNVIRFASATDTIGIQLFQAPRVTVSRNIIIGDEASPATSVLTGIAVPAGGDQSLQNLVISDNIIYSVAKGINATHRDGETIRIDGTRFQNVNQPAITTVVDSEMVFNNCTFDEFNALRFSGRAMFSNCRFERSAGHTAANKAVASFLTGGTRTVAGWHNNTLINSLDPMQPDGGSNFFYNEANNNRPLILQYTSVGFKINNIASGLFGNDGVAVVFSNAGVDLREGSVVTGLDNSNGYTTQHRVGNNNVAIYGGTALPPSGRYKQGDIAWNATPSAGGDPGWVCIKRNDSNVNGDEASGQTVISIDDDTGMASGDTVGILLDAGFIHWTTINGAPAGNDITLTVALPSAAADDNNVYTHLFKPMADLDA